MNRERERKVTVTKKEIMARIASRATLFDKGYKDSMKRMADVARKDLAALNSLFGGPCTVTFSDQAPFVVSEGETYGPGASLDVFKSAATVEDPLRFFRVSDAEVIRIYLKISKAKKGLKIDKGIDPRVGRLISHLPKK